MEQVSYYATAAAFTIVILAWFIFAATFLLRKKPEGAPETKRASKSFIGIALQGVTFGLVWSIRRAPFLSPFIDGQYALNLVFQLAAVALSVAAVWTANSAIKELGKQWSFGARLIEDHKLVTSGVYRIVRHPIYFAMFANLLATGFVLSHWLVVPAAVVVFLIGTRIRTAAEERLLREAFPDEYDKYSRKVASFIPLVRI
jgi:protein-S-isoprenylcysteine O-methyltransferase Ste14